MTTKAPVCVPTLLSLLCLSAVLGCQKFRDLSGLPPDGRSPNDAGDPPSPDAAPPAPQNQQDASLTGAGDANSADTGQDRDARAHVTDASHEEDSGPPVPGCSGPATLVPLQFADTRVTSVDDSWEVDGPVVVFGALASQSVESSRVCIEGVPGPDGGLPEFVGFRFDANNPVSAGMPQPYDIATRGIVGISYRVTGLPLGSLRLTVHEGGTGTGYCKSENEPRGSYQTAFTDLKEACWQVVPGPSAVINAVVEINFVARSNPENPDPFNFCVEDLALIACDP